MVRLSIPDQLLECPEPPDFIGSSIREAIAWGIEVWTIAMDCRSKLVAVKEMTRVPGD